MLRAYLSNLSPLWPWEKQEDLLRQEVPAWPKGVTVYRDDLDARQRRGRSQDALAARSNLLRTTTRRRADDVILLPSLAVLDWTHDGVVTALAAASARGATVRVLDCGLEIAADAGAAVMAEVAKAFATAKMRDKLHRRGEAGGRVSGAARKAAAAEKMKAVAALWHDPKETRTDAELARMAGVSVNTMKAHHGPRYNRKKIKAARAAKERV